MTANEFTPEQKRIIKEIQRIAKKLGAQSLSEREFDEHHKIGGVTTAGMQFGSWNVAVTAAGLTPNPPSASNRKKTYTDQELLEDILRVHRLLGHSPSERKMAAHGRYSPKPYRDRWGTFSNGRAKSYTIYGEPET